MCPAPPVTTATADRSPPVSPFGEAPRTQVISPIPTGPGPRERRLRSPPSPSTTAQYFQQGQPRAELWTSIRRSTIASALAKVGLALPTRPFPVHHGPPERPRFSINTPMQTVLSEYVRRTRIPLPQFIELLRGQSESDYRPNKAIIPTVVRDTCAGYRRLHDLSRTASEGIHVTTSQPLPSQTKHPANQPSAISRINVLRKNIRKEQDLGRCIVVVLDIRRFWPEIFLSPFGVVDKGDGDPYTSGRVIHDLSYPDGSSVNDLTVQADIPVAEYVHCDAIAKEILRQADRFPDDDIKLMLGDVAAAFRSLGVHSHSAHKFAGTTPSENALVIDLSAGFGWTGSPGHYDVAGGAIAHIHGNTVNRDYAEGLYNYFWVDDHVCVVADWGTNCSDVEQSLRTAMMSVLGSASVNNDKFTGWSTSQKVLGLVFDTKGASVSMPPDKITKATTAVHDAYQAASMTRSQYRSLLGSLRHIATCVRPARPFLQRLRRKERHLSRWSSITVDSDMKEDLRWRSLILQNPVLNGVPLAYFRAQPPHDITIETDVSDTGLCAVDKARRRVIVYQYSSAEKSLIGAFHNGQQNSFDINYRELLACVFAVLMWSDSWASTNAANTTHVHFRVDNTSAVAWQTKMASRNPRAQTLIRLLGYFETTRGLSFSSSHIAGVDNIVADAGSRLSSSDAMRQQFTNLTRGWKQVQPPFCSDTMEETWHNICESIRWPTLHSRNTPPRSDSGVAG